MFNNYSSDYAGFISIPKGMLPPKFTMSDINFHRIKNPHHVMRTFVSDMTLKRIDKDMIHIVFPWTFDKDVMGLFNVADP